MKRFDARRGLAQGARGAFSTWLVASCAYAQGDPALPQEVVAADNTRITRSCRLIIAPRPLEDSDNNGVVHIEGDNLTVDLSGQTLIGADPATPQDQMRGIGLVLRGTGITIRNGTVTGFRVGISATQCNNTTIERMEFINNYAQRLFSTPDGEDARDWLTPHENDHDEWLTRYGAAVAVRESRGVTLREIGVRKGQNGIVLSRVNESQVFNCDCSFLSGWGLALWRSSHNTICRNSFDFCVRGYSHEVYNRGQDSAGILCFEQSSDNIIALNSATHCGDGFFGFAGREALGEALPNGFTAASPPPSEWYRGRGSNKNLIAMNDFSDAAAHGIETTFSFATQIVRNRVDRSAICGVWGGYSKGLQIRGNLLRANGSVGAREGGAINIEHGSHALISDNLFSSNSVGVNLWWDEDTALSKLPWVLSNGGQSSENAVVRNAFDRDAVGVRLLESPHTTIALNSMSQVPTPLDADAVSERSIGSESALAPADWTSIAALEGALPGAGNAVRLESGIPTTVREQLVGRGAILMGEFGPYDFIAPMAILEPGTTAIHRWKLLGSQPIQFAQASQATSDIRASIEPESNIVRVETETPGTLSSYELSIYWGRAPNQVQRVHGTILSALWRVSVFRLPHGTDPTTPPTRDEFDHAAIDATVVYVDSLTCPFRSGGPDSVKLIATAPDAPRDHFGLRATTTFQAAAGEWIIQTKSDDGVRVWVGSDLVIDNWTHHALTVDRAPLSIPVAKEITLKVEYFERIGEAHLDLKIYPDPTKPQIAPPPVSAP